MEKTLSDTIKTPSKSYHQHHTKSEVLLCVYEFFT